MHLNKTQIKEQIKIHTHIFKESGDIMKLGYTDKKRDVKIEMQYIHHIDEKEGNISNVILILEDEEQREKYFFNPTDAAGIFETIKKWHTEQKLDFLTFPKEKVQPELFHN